MSDDVGFVQPGPGVPPAEDWPRWRVGEHYGIHVYEVDPDGAVDRPVGTFHRPVDAAMAVVAVNRGVVPDEEFVLMPPRGWLNRIDEVLLAAMFEKDDLGTEAQRATYWATSQKLGDLVRSWAVGLDNPR